MDHGRTGWLTARPPGQCRGCALGGAFQHGGDPVDRDDVEVQRECTGSIDAVGTVAAHQSLETIDGAHPGPGQRIIEDAFGVNPDVGPVCSTRRDQPRQVPQRVADLVLGQIISVGAAAAWRLAGMDLHQRGAVIELHQLAIGAHVQRDADPLLGQRIQRFADLGVEVAVHFDRFEYRHVIDARHRQQQRLFFGGDTSTGRAQAVPWMRVPAVRSHHAVAACCACSRLVNVSPSQKFRRTYCTARSTRGLSLGERTRAGSVRNPT